MNISEWAHEDAHAIMIAKLSDWVDSYPPNAERDKEAQLWGRVVKVREEQGEIIEAMIGYTNQNPRKGVTHTIDDVKKELFDVALAALGGVEHINGNNGNCIEEFFAHIEKVYSRAGLHSDIGIGNDET